jgi:hypothetical protein
MRNGAQAKAVIPVPRLEEETFSNLRFVRPAYSHAHAYPSSVHPARASSGRGRAKRSEAGECVEPFDLPLCFRVLASPLNQFAFPGLQVVGPAVLEQLRKGFLEGVGEAFQ